MTEGQETQTLKIEQASQRIESVSEIKELVFPQGATNALSIEVSNEPRYIVTSNGPRLERFGTGVKVQKEELIDNKTMESLQPVKDILGQLMDSRKFTNHLLAKDKERKDARNGGRYINLSTNDLKVIVPDIESPAGERLIFVLNYGFDPELIRPVMRQFQEKSPLSKELTEFITDDEEARERLEAMVLKDVQISRADTGEELTRFQEELDAFKKDLTDYCQTALEDDQAASQLEQFYRAYDGGFCDFVRDLKSTTSAAYFQRHFSYDDEWKKSHPGLTDYGSQHEMWDNWRPYEHYDCLANTLVEYAQAVETTDYLVWLQKEGKQLYQTLFPEIFVDLPVRIYVENKYKTKEEALHCAGVDQLNAFFSGKHNVISIDSAYPACLSVPGAQTERVPVVFVKRELGESYQEPEMVSRKVSDLMLFIHEYTHSLYLHLQRQRTPDISERREKLKEDESWQYSETSDSAFNEGLAVMMESVAEYKIRQNPEKYGFTEDDLSDLAALKRGRLATFKRQHREGKRDQYMQGTLDIMHGVYKDAIKGSKDEEAIPAGVEAMFDLVESLDPDKTYAIKRTDSQYQQALRNRQNITSFCFQ